MTENGIEHENREFSKGEFSANLKQKPVVELAGNATTMQLVDALLKNPERLIRQIESGQSRRSITIFLAIGVVGYLIYGVIVGSFSGNIQWLAAPAKILFGSVLSSLLCFPSLYIFACLSGASISPTQALALVGSGMGLTAILLLGFVPVAFVFTFSIESLFCMGAIHLLVWGVSMYFGLRYINAGLGRMSCRDNRLMKAWGLILIVTMLQMSTTLRPTIGESELFLTTEKRSFVEHWIENGSSSKRE